MTDKSGWDPADGLRKVLNLHGYGFQYSTLKRCLEARPTVWQVAATEFPVELNDTDIHIDFILGYHSHLIVAECKRVDPALSRWGFARSKLVHSARSGSPPRVDFLEYLRGQVHRHAVSLNSVLSPYHVGIEYKSGDKGNSTGRGRDALIKAITQVLRGRGGLMEHLHREKAWGGSVGFAGGVIILVVFTSAELLTTDSLLEDADLATGEMPKDMEASEQEWLWLDHHMSVDLRPRHVPARPHSQPRPSGR